MGQPATLTADLYGSSVKYHGTVVGFSAGTGASFALLPAQNATGNWIKVVQRLPVRIVLDPKDLAAHPLQVGLSMRVQVATANRDGARLPQQTAATAPTYSTGVFDDADRQAQARVDAIIAANLPAPAHGRMAHHLAQVGTRPTT
jgi:membrane fusion protein (multidrug efflux system)